MYLLELFAGKCHRTQTLLFHNHSWCRSMQNWHFFTLGCWFQFFHSYRKFNLVVGMRYGMGWVYCWYGVATALNVKSSNHACWCLDFFVLRGRTVGWWGLRNLTITTTTTITTNARELTEVVSLQMAIHTINANTVTPNTNTLWHIQKYKYRYQVLVQEITTESRWAQAVSSPGCLRHAGQGNTDPSKESELQYQGKRFDLQAEFFADQFNIRPF